MSPVFFVVERRAGHVFPALIYDQLPQRLRDKGNKLLVYAMRLDKMPNADELIAKPVADLFVEYKRLRDAKKLPNNLADPPRADIKSGQQGIEHGARWEFKPLPRGDDWAE